MEVVEKLDELDELDLDVDESLSQLSLGHGQTDATVVDHPPVFERRKRFRGRRNPRKKKTKSRDDAGDQIGGCLALSLSLRVEKNVICLLLGRRVIKTLVRRTAGKHGATLVDLVYKLSRITLGKQEAKKLMKRTLNIIAEVSVLTIHRKLSPHLLDSMRTALLTPLRTFQEMQNPQMDPSLPQDLLSLEEQERHFTDSIRLAEKEMFIFLQPLVQERTLNRFVKVARILRDPAIVRAAFLQEGATKSLPGVRELVQEMLNTVGEMAEESRGRELERVSKSKSKSRPRRPRTKGKSKKITEPSSRVCTRSN